MLLDVSSGEAFDKLSILEIKHRRITSLVKRSAVLQEIQALAPVVALKERYPFEYAFITKVNEEIWDLTETLDPSKPDFVTVSERIFDLNRKRFRAKRMINNAENSGLKEQKSLGELHCLLQLDVDPEVHRSRFYSIAFEYDTFSFDRPCQLWPFGNFVETTPESHVVVKLSSIPDSEYK